MSSVFAVMAVVFAVMALVFAAMAVVFAVMFVPVIFPVAVIFPTSVISKPLISISVLALLPESNTSDKVGVAKGL